MSAGNNVYSKNRLNGKDSEGNIKTTLPALFLTDYQNATKFKELFYCDEVWIQKDSENKQIINGLVEENGTNLSMRDVKRKGNLRIRKDNKNYVVLNDGGLNTYAYITTSMVGENAYANYIKLEYNIKSAYYSTSKEYGVYMTLKRGNTTVVTDQKFALTKVIASKAEYTTQYIFANMATFEKNDKVIFTPYIINDEGEKKYAPLDEITVKDQLRNFTVKKVEDITQEPTTEEQIIYMDGDQYNAMLALVQSTIATQNSIYPFTDQDMKNRLANGMYNLVEFLKVGRFDVDQLGAYTQSNAIIRVTNDGVTNWFTGQWPIVTPKINIKIVPNWLTSSEGTRLLSYTLQVDNSQFTTTIENLVVNIWATKIATKYQVIHTHNIIKIVASQVYEEYIDLSAEEWIDTQYGITRIDIVSNKTTSQYDIVTPILIPIQQ